MASIDLVDASVEIPIFNSRGRSLKTTLIRRVGGQVETDGNDVVTVKALRRLNLSLRPGDRLGLIGHNGAGKSTLLRVLAGSYEPSTGTADIHGTVSSLIDMEMGMDPELTGADNIIQRGLFLGMSLKEARRAIPQIAHYTFVVPGGQAAIALIFLAYCRAGSHVLVPDSAYRPAAQFASGLLTMACRQIGDSPRVRTRIHRLSATMELTDATVRIA